MTVLLYQTGRGSICSTIQRRYLRHMASQAVKYTLICLLICAIGSLLYLSEYSMVGGGRLTSITTNIDSKNAIVIDKQLLRQELVKLLDKYKNKDIEVVSSSDNNQDLDELLKDIQQTPKTKTTSSIDKETQFPHLKYFNVVSQVEGINCNAMFKNDTVEINRTIEITKDNPKVEVSAKEYTLLASNCSKFTESRGYIMNSLTQMEEKFPIAYSLLMFQNVEQSERLLRAIYRPQNLYCIHVDNKSDSEVYEAMVAISNCFDNIFMTSQRFDVRWGTMTVLQPDLLCMEQLWKRSNQWKYFINLTGQEFPLKTNYELVKVLMAYNGANDVEGTVKRANKGRWTAAGTPPHNITATKGSVHIVVQRGYVDYLLHDQRAKDLLNWTRSTQVPDEVFFSTLNHNPHLGVPGAYKGVPETHPKDKPFMTRFKNWGGGMYDWPCYGKRVRLICVFGTGDLPLLGMRKELFANKFHLDYHQFGLDCMEELNYNHTRDEYLGKLSFDDTWYSKLSYVTNKVV